MPQPRLWDAPPLTRQLEVWVERTLRLRERRRWCLDQREPLPYRAPARRRWLRLDACTVFVSLQSTAKMVIPLPLFFTLCYFFSFILSYFNCVFSVSCSAFQEVCWDREGCPNQLRQGIWQARRHCRCHWPEQSNSPTTTQVLTFIHICTHPFACFLRISSCFVDNPNNIRLLSMPLIWSGPKSISKGFP